MYKGKSVVVPIQYLDDGRKKHDIELGTGLYTGGSWKNECSFVVFGCCEVGGHEVGE